MTFLATYFGSSGWLIELGDVRILIDPWLKGSLEFAPGRWFFEGKLNQANNIPDNINLLLLTQGLSDHTHVPSLNLLPRSIQVVGSASAAKKVRKIGYKNVKALTPGQNFKYGDLLIEATAGAPVPNIENGYILNHPDGSLYFEPHGFFDRGIRKIKLDSVITPVINLGLPLFGNFINGKTILPELINFFEPKIVLASTTGGDATFSGLLNTLIKQEGSIEEIQKIINEQTKLLDPQPGKTYQLNTY